MSDAPRVWMNGELMPADAVRVSPFDLGLSVGWGVFETLCGYDGKVFAFMPHYARLLHSAGVMQIHVPHPEMLLQAIGEVIGANGLEAGRARIRISLSGGEYPLTGGGDAKNARGNVLVSAVALHSAARQVSLLLSPFPHNERSGLSGCKSSSYGNNLMALRHAVAAGADEAVMLNTEGQLCECATANLFTVVDGVIKTPSLASGCLAGVTRERVIDLARGDGMGVVECDLTPQDLEHAEEIFLTSSTREVQPAFMLGDTGDSVGNVTARLAELYHQYIREELDA